MRAVFIGVFLAAAWAGSALAAETLIEINDLRPEEIQVVGFELSKPAKLNVEAVGLRTNYSNDLAAYAWLLDHDTREPVWVMKKKGAGRVKGRGAKAEVETEIELQPGKYELYMSAMNRWQGDWSNQKSFSGVGDFFRFLGNAIRDGSFSDNYEDDLRNCYVRLSSDGLTAKELKSFEVTGDIDGAILRFNRLGNDEYIKRGFSLTKPMALRVHAMIELPDDYSAPVDHGWIVDSKTGKRVWEMRRSNSEPAGGGRKNRVVDDDVQLEAGEYVLYYVTDDSHSYEWFNVNPPYDPMNWGITVLPGANFQAAAFKEYEPAGRGEALVDLTRARDDDYLEQAFTLKAPSELHVYCVGEYVGSGNEFADYGTIQGLSSGQIVWEMTRRNTQHAGGAEKNRMFDGTISLPAGKYLASYTTDGSHSYRDWSSSAPYEQDAWGLSIYPGDGFKASDFAKSDAAPAAEGEALVRLTRIRDDQERQAEFKLDKATRVHIHALGEGSDGNMHDYGWIEDERGRTVWEMTYRRTRHAGGADKNRSFDGEVLLEPGKYEVFFVTDGSHSYNDWNSDRPRRPEDWGITVSAVVDEPGASKPSGSR
jgi:hypothetical protein